MNKIIVLGNSGAGKSSFALYAYVYKPLINVLATSSVL